MDISGSIFDVISNSKAFILVNRASVENDYRPNHHMTYVRSESWRLVHQREDHDDKLDIIVRDIQ